MSKNKPEDYATFWKEFGMVIKEGVVEDFANKDKIYKAHYILLNIECD